MISGGVKGFKADPDLPSYEHSIWPFTGSGPAAAAAVQCSSVHRPWLAVPDCERRADMRGKALADMRENEWALDRPALPTPSLRSHTNRFNHSVALPSPAHLTGGDLQPQPRDTLPRERVCERIIVDGRGEQNGTRRILNWTRPLM